MEVALRQDLQELAARFDWLRFGSYENTLKQIESALGFSQASEDDSFSLPQVLSLKKKSSRILLSDSESEHDECQAPMTSTTQFDCEKQVTISDEEDSDDFILPPLSTKKKPARNRAICSSDEEDSTRAVAPSNARKSISRGRRASSMFLSRKQDSSPSSSEVEDEVEDEVVAPSAPIGGGVGGAINPISEEEEGSDQEEDDSFIVPDDYESEPEEPQKETKSKQNKKIPQQVLSEDEDENESPPCYKTPKGRMCDSDEDDIHDENTEPQTPRINRADSSTSLPAWCTPATPFTPHGRQPATHVLPYTTPKAASVVRSFAKQRDKLTAFWFREFNIKAFGGKLPADLEVKWSKRLNKTAGITHLRRSGTLRIADIELSTKVVDTEDKLRNTLCHEMCHAVAFLVNGVSKPPHGDMFYAWAAVAMKAFPDLSIQRCHTYDINFKFTYVCLGENCGRTYGRHSKSIDPERHRCGYCHGALALQPRLRADGTPAAARSTNVFAAYVKANFADVRSKLGGLAHADVMRELGARFKAGLSGLADRSNGQD